MELKSGSAIAGPATGAGAAAVAPAASAVSAAGVASARVAPATYSALTGSAMTAAPRIAATKGFLMRFSSFIVAPEKGGRAACRRTIGTESYGRLKAGGSVAKAAVPAQERMSVTRLQQRRSAPATEASRRCNRGAL